MRDCKPGVDEVRSSYKKNSSGGTFLAVKFCFTEAPARTTLYLINLKDNFNFGYPKKLSHAMFGVVCAWRIT